MTIFTLRPLTLALLVFLSLAGCNGVQISAPVTPHAFATKLATLPADAFHRGRITQSCEAGMLIGGDSTVRDNFVHRGDTKFFRLDGNVRFQGTCLETTGAAPTEYSCPTNPNHRPVYLRVTRPGRGGDTDDVLFDCFEGNGSGSAVNAPMLSTRVMTESSEEDACDGVVEVGTIAGTPGSSNGVVSIDPARTKSFRADSYRVRWRCGNDSFEHRVCPNNTDAVTITREATADGDNLWIDCYEPR